MKRILSVVISILALSALFLLGFTWRDLQSGKAPSAGSFGRLMRVVKAPKQVTDSQLYQLSLDRISNDYYRSIDTEKLALASFEGLTASLGDPHTSFLIPKVATEFQAETSGTFVGVGARLAPDPLGAKVATVFDKGPAATAGVRNLDVITAVDGVSVSGKAIDSIVSKIRGEPGTTVKLTVIRVGAKSPLTFAIKRAEITTPTVDAKVIPGTTFGYLSISSFSEVTCDQFDAGLDKLDKAKITGLIIDVRSNPGGLLNIAQKMLSRFVEKKTVVTMKLRNNKKEEVDTSEGNVREFGYPIVVLMNDESASAAEIFAGVLHDYRLATLVGDHSYGKASVQTTYGVNYRRKDREAPSMLKITIARYYLPGGEDIGRKIDEDGQYLSGGLEPDVRADLNYDLTPTFGELKTDSQLQKAVEVLKSKQDR